MKMSKKYFGFAGAIWIAGMLWAPAVRAQVVAPHFGSRAGIRRGGGGMMLRLLRRGAILTADKKIKFSKIMRNNRPHSSNLSNQLQRLRQGCRTRLLFTGPV